MTLSFWEAKMRWKRFTLIGDLFLIPSGSESFGLSALEAMSCSVPVIASNAGGLPEVVVDGKTGFISPIGDVEKNGERRLVIAPK